MNQEMTQVMTMKHFAARVLAAVMLCVALGLVSTSAASADFSVLDFDGAVSNQDGTAATAAGSHPYEISTTFDFSTMMSPSGFGFDILVPDHPVKTIQVATPPGLIGDPSAVDQCSPTQLGIEACPVASQVGTVGLRILVFGSVTTPRQAVFNMVPPPGMPAQFGFIVNGQTVYLNASVRTGGDYGLNISLENISSAVMLVGSTLHLWGVPADPSHDAERQCPAGVTSCSPGTSRRPFLTLPTSCAGPQTTTLRAAPWLDPDNFKSASFVSHDEHGDPVGVTDCDRVPFDPSMQIDATSRSASSPTGLDVTLKVPQNQNPDGLAQANLKKAVVTLPAGVSVNPSSANGLAACSPAQADLTGAGAATCPDASKIGTVEIDSSLIDHPLKGGVYLASQDDNPFHSMLAMYVAVDDPATGVVIKLPGLIETDPVTGQVTTTLDNNPQLPFETFKLSFKSGARAALSLPAACGTYASHYVLTPWSGRAPVSGDTSMVIDQNCADAGKFEPSMEAGVTNPAAGSDTSFALTVRRPDGQQDISGLDVTLPPGVLGRVGSVPLCPEERAAAGTCAADSRVGSTSVLSGAGTSPVSIPQAGKAPTAVFLAGPYKGAPFSLSIVVPAQAGPLNLGTVVVRAALFIDPIDAHVTVKSDPLPTILLGVPLKVQAINVTIDRSRFIVNPTNCNPMQVAAHMTSTAGTAVDLANRFQIGGCESLTLKPALGLTLSGKGQTTDGKHPAVSANLVQSAGQANLKKVRVALPLSLALDPDNAASDGLCSFVEGSKPDPKCPASSVVGKATAVTPVLNEPLSGPVFFVKNERKDPKSGRSIKTTPKLVIPLVGENGVKLTLTGESTVVDDRLVTTFDNIPDAPVSSFKLDISGGKKGILVISGDKADICKSTQIADQQVDGQNNKNADADVYIQTPSCPLKVLSKKVGKSSVAVKVGGLGAGKVTVTGRGIKKTTKTITKSTVATITAKRTRGRPGRVTVSFDPAGPAKARKTSK